MGRTIIPAAKRVPSAVWYITPAYEEGCSSLFTFPSHFLRFSLLNDPFTFTMRFSIIAAFILPLAALAAPAPARIKLDVLPLCQQLTAAITETTSGLDSTIFFLRDPTLPIDQGPLQTASDKANEANDKLKFATSSAAIVEAALKTGGQVNDDAYVDNPRMYEGQND